MNPAFSVIFFTTASGAGFGAFAWLGLAALCGMLPPRGATLIALLLAGIFTAAGLLSSVGHLGQPLRAWRAFSQWRSSWLSREGVFATLCFLPALWLGWLAWSAPLQVGPSLSVRVAGALLAALAIASVVCTAMIYASLKPVPAWRHPLVLPVYLLFALFSGGLLLAAIVASSGLPLSNMVGLGAIAGAFLLWRLKSSAWRYADQDAVGSTRNSALGLPHTRAVQVFERPHTEANYLLKEMGYVLARKHARRLRTLSVLLFALLPGLLALPLWLLPHLDAGGLLLALATASTLLGALVERWLFFAEAKHLVTLYY